MEGEREKMVWAGTGTELQRRGRSALVCPVCTVSIHAGANLGLWARARVRVGHTMAPRLEQRVVDLPWRHNS